MALDLSLTATQLLTDLASTDYVEAIDVSGEVFDPVTGTKTGGTTTTQKLVAAVINVAQNLIDGERIKTDDKQIIFDNQYTPNMSTVFKFGGAEYRTVMIDGFNHAGTQQFWKVICRK